MRIERWRSTWRSNISRFSAARLFRKPIASKHMASIRRRAEPLAIWGFVLGSLLLAVVTVATVTVSVAQAALY